MDETPSPAFAYATATSASRLMLESLSIVPSLYSIPVTEQCKMHTIIARNKFPEFNLHIKMKVKLKQNFFKLSTFLHLNNAKE